MLNILKPNVLMPDIMQTTLPYTVQDLNSVIFSLLATIGFL